MYTDTCVCCRICVWVHTIILPMTVSLTTFPGRTSAHNSDPDTRAFLQFHKQVKTYLLHLIKEILFLLFSLYGIFFPHISTWFFPVSFSSDLPLSVRCSWKPKLAEPVLSLRLPLNLFLFYFLSEDIFSLEFVSICIYLSLLSLIEPNFPVLVCSGFTVAPST